VSSWKARLAIVLIAPALLAAVAATREDRAPGVAAAQPAAGTPARPPSRALGLPYRGRLLNGVALAEESDFHYTWDFGLAASPNRWFRRYGTGRLVAMVARVTGVYGAAHPDLARVGVADLSLPRGGPFGTRWGGLGHRSHQNGLDVDVLYPRRDLCECPPDTPADVDRVRSQELVNLFVRAGAQYVFVGQRVGLRGPRRVVEAIPLHDDHMHVRIPPDRPAPAPRQAPRP